MQTHPVKKTKKYWLSIGVGAIASIAALYAWVAVAATPSNGTAGAASSGTASTGALSVPVIVPVGATAPNPIDPAVQTMVDQSAVNIQNQHNTAINGDLFAATTLSPAQTVTTQHFSAYCSSASESGNCPSDPSLTMGDIKVASVFKSSTYDAPSQAAAQAFIQTLLTPLDNSSVSSFQTAGNLNANTLAGDSNLQAQYAQALSDESVLSIIRQAFAEMMAIRTPPPAAQGVQAGPSEMGLMEQTVLQRWMNSTWTNNLANLTPTQMQQDMALMQAFQNYMSFKLYQQGERQLAVDALLALQNYRSQKNGNSLVNKTNTAPSMSPASSDSSGDSGQ